jgi:hypothetical protein
MSGNGFKIKSPTGEYYFQEFRETKALRTILRHFIRFRIGFD